MLDITQYEELAPAPRALFERAAQLGARPRFMVATPDGDWRAVTWGRFARDVRQLALYLESVGLEPTDRAAIFAPNRVEWMTAAMAIQSAGGVMVPVYPASLAEQAAYVIDHSDAKVVFVDTEPLLERVLRQWRNLAEVRRLVMLDGGLDVSAVLRRLRSAGHDVPDSSEVEARSITLPRALTLGAARDEEQPDRFDALLGQLDLERPALMLYTSGTTGNPKGVPLTHRNVAQNGLDWLRSNAPSLCEGMVDLLWLPMSHIFGYGEACAGNMLGFTTYLTTPTEVLPLLPTVRPDVFMSVPAYWEKLAQNALGEPDREARRAKLQELTGGRLAFCLSGGAGLKREVKELFHDCGILIIEGYGLSECSPTLTLNRPKEFRFDSVGKPLASVELRLAEDGEILARGPNVFAGYHKDEEATREAFTPDGWFKTGDVGRFTDDGFLQIIDRKKEILVTAGGKNVPPANIETRFADEPAIAHLVVYGDGKKYLVAGVWLNHEAVDEELSRRGVPLSERPDAANDLVREAVDRQNEKLAKFEQVKKFALFDKPLTVAGGLLTSTLKVRRKKVYEAFGPQLESLYE